MWSMWSSRAARLAIVTLFAANSVACSLNIESILGVQEGSAMEITVLSLPPQVLELEGGTVMNIDVNLSLLDLILGRGINGDISIGELLFTAPPFDFLGIPVFNTHEICVVKDENLPSGGDFNADLGDQMATFDVVLNTIALIGNPVLAANLPGGGFAFPFNLNSQVPLSLGDMLGLLTGSGDLEITQPLDEDIDIVLDPDGPGGNPGQTLAGHIGGSITIEDVDVFPTSPLLEDCIAFLAQ